MDIPQYFLHKAARQFGDAGPGWVQQLPGLWKVIDPQGVIGAPFLESARFIQNHVIDQDDVFHWDMLNDTVAYFAARLGESTYTIASAFFILHVLSTCWGCEMNYEEDRLARLIDECGALLAYVRAMQHCQGGGL